jgi:hypothetical protein
LHRKCSARRRLNFTSACWQSGCLHFGRRFKSCHPDKLRVFPGFDRRFIKRSIAALPSAPFALPSPLRARFPRTDGVLGTKIGRRKTVENLGRTSQSQMGPLS